MVWVTIKRHNFFSSEYFNFSMHLTPCWLAHTYNCQDFLHYLYSPYGHAANFRYHRSSNSDASIPIQKLIWHTTNIYIYIYLYMLYILFINQNVSANGSSKLQIQNIIFSQRHSISKIVFSRSFGIGNVSYDSRKFESCRLYYRKRQLWCVEWYRNETIEMRNDIDDSNHR